MQIEEKIRSTELALDAAELTMQYGLQSFQYDSSEFLAEVERNIRLGPADVLFDLGCGYGELLFYLAGKFPAAQFTGIEIVKERFDIAAEACHLRRVNNIRFIHGDILKEDLSAGTVFYIFNPLFEFQYPVLARRLRKVARDKKIMLITEGKACIYFNQLRWLSEIRSIDNDSLSWMKMYESK